MLPSQATRARAVLLGASNVARGLAPALREAAARLRTPLDVLVAAGRGRSYGAPSSFLGRALPSVLESGIWRALGSGPAGAPLHALVADVGNDLVYGHAPERVAGWVAECLARLERAGARPVLMGLPLESVQSAPPLVFGVARRLFFPGRGLGRATLLERARELDGRLADLARERGLPRVAPRGEWYGLDPIHFGGLSRARRARAWHELLEPWGAAPEGTSGRAPQYDAPGALSLALAAPERSRLLGVERRGPQPALALSGGGGLYLY